MCMLFRDVCMLFLAVYMVVCDVGFSDVCVCAIP